MNREDIKRALEDCKTLKAIAHLNLHGVETIKQALQSALDDGCVVSKAKHVMEGLRFTRKPKDDGSGYEIFMDEEDYLTMLGRIPTPPTAESEE